MSEHKYFREMKTPILLEQESEKEIRLPLGDKINKYQEKIYKFKFGILTDELIRD